MKITYITHSSILVETEDATIITDPWFNGPAYLEQWHVFPKPADTEYISRVTHVVLTHGHEDHFHIPTLELIGKKSEVLIPYTWKSGMKNELQQIGFRDIRELSSYKTVGIGKHLRLTFIVNGLDSVILLEYKGLVYVNLNDAFNATHKAFVRLLSDRIRKRWPVIDYLMCGVGGAGYFPNAVHSADKNDREIGLLREQFLMHSFCEFVRAFRPRYAVPFLPGFALLEKDKRWINEVRLPRTVIAGYYQQHIDPGGSTEFLNLYPGDMIEAGKWLKSSPYHAQVPDDNWSFLVHEQYEDLISSMDQKERSEGSIGISGIIEALNALFPQSTAGINPEALEKLNFSIELKNAREPRFIHCRMVQGSMSASPDMAIPVGARLNIRTDSKKLMYAIREIWGGDVFFIGYGADIDIIDPTCLEDNLDILSLRILSRFPRASRHVFREPFRAAKYFSGNMMHASLAIKHKLMKRNEVNKLPFNERTHWINKSKCEVCLACDLPLLSDSLGEHIIRS